MRAGEAAESEIAIILSWQLYTIGARARGVGWHSTGGTCAWTRRAVAAVAGEVAEAEIVPWAGAGDADAGTSGAAGGADGGCGHCGEG